jgi:hypothetical protein
MARRFSKLRPGECRWILQDEPPFTDPKCCALKAVERGSWCKKHRKIVFRPKEAKRKLTDGL